MCGDSTSGCRYENFDYRAARPKLANGGMLARSWSRTTLTSSFRVGRDDPPFQTDRHRLAVLGYGTLQGGLGSRRRLCQGQSESRDTAWRVRRRTPALEPLSDSMITIHSQSYNRQTTITTDELPSGTLLAALRARAMAMGRLPCKHVEVAHFFADVSWLRLPPARPR
jgi:hypothetical protein